MATIRKFLQCELKFIFWLISGLIILNAMSILLHIVFHTDYFISIIISVIVFGIYLIYFIYQIIKLSLFKIDYKCMNIQQRVNSWLSSLINI